MKPWGMRTIRREPGSSGRDGAVARELACLTYSHPFMMQRNDPPLNCAILQRCCSGSGGLTSAGALALVGNGFLQRKIGAPGRFPLTTCFFLCKISLLDVTGGFYGRKA